MATAPNKTAILLLHPQSKVTITPVILDTVEDEVVGKGTPQEVTIEDLAAVLKPLVTDPVEP